MGLFFCSVLNARGLEVEGLDPENLNVYAFIQIQFSKNVSQFSAISLCSLSTPNPEWNQTFRFDLDDSLGSSAFISVHLFTAMPDKKGSLAFPKHEEFRKTELTEESERNKLNQIFDKATLRAEKTKSQEQAIRERLGKGSAEEEKVANRLMQFDLKERRWAQLKQLHASTPDLILPNVPRNHIPVGYVVIPFRTLREAVYSEQAVRYDRPLRGAARGSIKIDLEYRPKFWGYAPRREDVKLSTPRGTELAWDARKITDAPVTDAHLHRIKIPEHLQVHTTLDKYKGLRKKMPIARNLSDCLAFSRQVSAYLDDDNIKAEPMMKMTPEVKRYVDGANFS